MEIGKDTFEGGPRRAWLFAVLVFFSLFFTYLAMAPCLDNGFTNWDEAATIIHNPRIKTLSAESVKTIFTTPDLRMYAPLSTLSYALNYHYAGLDPRAYHGVDLLLHLANTALVLLLARLLFGGLWTPFFIALLFGIHPAHVESVAWAAERKDVLYSFFYLASLAAYASRPGGRAAYLASFALFVCALLAKPMAVTLPAALLLVDYLKAEKLGLRQVLYKIPFFVLSAVFAAVLVGEPGNVLTMHWAKRLLVPLYNLGFYLYTLLWPFNLSAMYIAPPGGRPAVYLLAAAAAAGSFCLWKYFRRDKELVFGAAFYALMLLPVLQFFPCGPVISADRYTYLSSLGVFAVAAVLARRWWQTRSRGRQAAAAACALAAVLVLTTASRLRCAVWKDSVSLWTDTLRKQPPADYLLLNLSDAYLQANMTGEAAACITRALAAYPGSNNHRYNACRLLVQLKEPAKAEGCFSNVLALNPCHATALNHLGDISASRGEAAKAELYYTRAARCDGASALAYLNLAKLALARKDKAGAALFYGRALAAEPADREIRARLDALR